GNTSAPRQPPVRACAPLPPALAIAVPRGPGAMIGLRFLLGEDGLTMDLTLIAIGLGLLAVVYGFVTSRQVLSASPGTARMQEIAGAIQEGAQAYLKRQYTTIAVVGIVVAVIAVFLGLISAVG